MAEIVGRIRDMIRIYFLLLIQRNCPSCRRALESSLMQMHPCLWNSPVLSDFHSLFYQRQFPNPSLITGFPLSPLFDFFFSVPFSLSAFRHAQPACQLTLFEKAFGVRFGFKTGCSGSGPCGQCIVSVRCAGENAPDDVVSE